MAQGFLGWARSRVQRLYSGNTDPASDAAQHEKTKSEGPVISARWYEIAVDLLYPPHCTVCERATRGTEHLCGGCREKAVAIKKPFCRVCSEPFFGQIEGEFVCAECEDRRFRFECAVAHYKSDEVVREVVHQFKYRKRVYLRHVLAEWLVEALDDPRLQTPRCDRLVPVPLHPVRRRERGFNQAHLLAEELEALRGIPVFDCLKRIRNTPTQTRLDRAARMENLRGAFELWQHARVNDLHLLLIDDILTTGSTVDECARVLLRAGAASVRVATVARA